MKIVQRSRIGYNIRHHQDLDSDNVNCEGPIDKASTNLASNKIAKLKRSSPLNVRF